MKINNSIIFLAMVSLILFACKSNDEDVPEKTIDEKTMSKIIVDFHLIEASILESGYDGGNSTPYAKFYYKSILKKHNIEYNDFIENINFYSKQNKKIDKIYTDVISELSILQSTVLHEKDTTNNKSGKNIIADSLKKNMLNQKKIKPKEQK